MPIKVPEVSVVIPTHNRPEKIILSIDSIVKQTFTNLEILIVNDGKDEGSIRDLLDKFADKRIRYLRNNRKGGANGARNTGLESANGNYIAFLDDDDTWSIDKIQKQLQKFKDSPKEVGFVYSGFEIVAHTKPEFSMKIFPQKKGKLLDEMISGNFIGSPTPLIKKNIFNKTGGYDEDLESAQDWELWIRISEHTEFEYVNEILAQYVVHGDQISIDFEKKIRSFNYIIKKHSNLYKQNKNALATIYKKNAVLSLMSGKINNSRKNLIRALITDPLRKDLIVHLVLSVFPTIYSQYINKYIAITCGTIKLIH